MPGNKITKATLHSRPDNRAGRGFKLASEPKESSPRAEQQVQDQERKRERDSNKGNINDANSPYKEGKRERDYNEWMYQQDIENWKPRKRT